MAHNNKGVKIEDMRLMRLLLIIYPLLRVVLAADLSTELPHESPLDAMLIQQSIEKPGPGKFLVSKRSLDDAHFGKSIVYLIDHDTHGSIGLIVNRPGDVSLSEAVPDINNLNAKSHSLYYGGPVGLPTILMLAKVEQPIEGMRHIVDDVYITSDRKLLDKILATEKLINGLRFYLGYSGWAPGQLDMEIAHGSWHVIDIEVAEIFSSDINSLWESLIEQLEPPGIQVEISTAFSELAWIAIE